MTLRPLAALPVRLAIAPAVAAAFLAGAPAAWAQQSQEWFIPGGQQRPQQGQARPQQRAQPSQQQDRTRAPAPLPAGQQPPAAVIGVVDIPEVQRVSTAFNQVREEIERRRAKLNDDLQREQQRWREEQQRLAAERAQLSPEQLRNRERELQDRITDAQRIFRDRQRSIEQAAQGALVEIERALGGVIRQVAGSRNVNIVLPRPLIIFNEPAFDLTEEVAQALNRAIRNVTIPPEDAPAGEQPRPAAERQPQPQQPRQGQAPRRN
jgi:Skp family chaperone for outer membrane proteins